ncbi:RNA polymerase sigma-70 factor [Nocardia vinacea]|uniref:RNA polymerase sigma-70 factor n=1 Tax=Nocardia vinacea TaxID=96468 RepID=A0ABZ1Z621_9NOCA|nr:RNA polymerase sigma-70 factor [Nocardia vinacea]
MSSVAALGGLGFWGFDLGRVFGGGRTIGSASELSKAGWIPTGTVIFGGRARKKVAVEPDGLREFQAHRPRLFALAYRMLGYATEAEDAVQETYLRWDGTDRTTIRSAEAWLTTAVVNLCRTWLVSARARRETYVGPWLPEPVPTARGELGPLETVEERELVSLALLTALERLSPIERAVFVLREAFGYAHREIADMLAVSEANSQQIFRRAGIRVREGRPRFDVPADQARELIERFLKAARIGDIEALERMLAADVVSTADGGGQVTAARRPIVGAPAVARYVAGLFRWEVPGMVMALEEINGALAVVVRLAGEPALVVGVDTLDDAVTALRLIVNPEKLTYIGRA